MLKNIVACGSVLALASASSSAGAPAPVAPLARAQAPDPWMMLSMLGPARAIALGGASSAAQPLPPAAPTQPTGLSQGAAPVAAVGLWNVLIVLALLADDDNSGAGRDTGNRQPNSPT